MASGPHHGAHHGAVHGAKHNTLIYGADPMAGVTQDAAAGIYVPATLDEVAQARAAAGLPVGAATSIWQFQDLSGGAVDVTGVNNLSEFGTVSYQNAVTGWTRKFCGMADGAAGAEFASVEASLPNPATTSVLIIAYIGFPTAPGASRTYMGLGNPTYQMRVDGSQNLLLIHGGASQAGVSNVGTTVRPHVLRSNVTATTNFFCTNQETITTAWSAPAGKRIDFGGFDAAAPNMRVGYAIMFTGAAAELTNAQIKALLQILGWTIAW